MPDASRFYENDGTWGVEGHGVDPGHRGDRRPGEDGQTAATRSSTRAIELMLEEVEKNPYSAGARPAYPDRRGMGLPDTDK